jgi:undecaprenyl diphosphate synthase
MIKRIIERIYVSNLIRRIEKNKLPTHVVVIMGDEPERLEKIKEISKWAEKIGIKELTFHTKGKTNLDDLVEKLKKRFKVEILEENSLRTEGKGGNTTVRIFFGVSGREEIINAVRRMAKKVLRGEIKAEEIDEELVKKHLVFKKEPDLIIRTGGSALADALIWQSIYSELYFTEVNWKNFREIDFLRAIRDYQKRERKFGK